MYYSYFEIFSVGIGPSSSHTVGPMRAAKRYVENLHRQNLFNQVERLEVILYGSLALTGIGHGTVKAVVYGLMGLEAEAIDPQVPYVNAVERDKILHLNQEKPIPFDLDKDVVFKKDVFLPEHSNGLEFKAFDQNGKELLNEVYFSVGGGTIARRDEISRRISRPAYNVPYEFNSYKELRELCKKENKSIAEIVYANECAIHGQEKTDEGIMKIYRIMQNAVDRGMKTEGILPGGLNVRRRAPEIYRQLAESFEANNYDPLQIIDWINLWAFAVAEENAAGGQIVTAPTMGSAGVMPAVTRYFERFAHVKSPYSVEEGLKIFMLTASAICCLYRSNASISGAEVGCQGEVGVACSMAAAGLTAARGGSLSEIENAAEIAMEHNLGLTCDPVGGLVQIPCIERNAMGAIKAVNSTRLALNGKGQHAVTLDSVIKTMYDTGRDMQNKYKETSLGGLAVNVASC
ncbi:MAG: L-serine ammonia-lyase [Pseudomonadota bacterium]|nr:L-serine ammonia-lyase [Pseudomonadota bacterium]